MQIKQEFKQLIPPLSAEEFKQLEENCLNEGIRDAIVKWQGFIIDGHNRYEIAQRHGLEYQTIEKHFESENDVIDWMIINQLGRRNITKEQRDYLIGKRYENEKLREGRPNKKLGKNYPIFSTAEKIAKEVNISEKQVKLNEQYAKGVDKLGEELKKQVLQGKSDVNKSDVQIISKAEPLFVAKTEKDIIEKAKEIRERKKNEINERREKIRNELDMQELEVTEKKYRIIYADPPWKYGNAMPEYVTEPQDYYLLMSTDDICAMPVKEIAEKNAVLFMWTTSPHLPEALTVVKAWGFEYKTTFIWDKIKHNMGHYNSVRHEILLVCTRGACTPDVKKLFDSVVSIERTEHSKKPEYFREIIETIYTHGNKIELFARVTPQGWDSFGNQK